MAASSSGDRRQAANIQSVTLLSDFRSSLAKFADDAQAGVSAADADVQRWLAWIEDTQANHWRGELARRRQQQEEARVNLARKTIGRVEDQAPHREEQVALERAKRRVAEAEAKLEAIQRWARLMRHEAEMYRGAVQGFQDVISVRVPLARAALDQITQRLEAYLTVTPPSTPAPTPPATTAPPPPPDRDREPDGAPPMTRPAPASTTTPSTTKPEVAPPNATTPDDKAAGESSGLPDRRLETPRSTGDQHPPNAAGT